MNSTKAIYQRLAGTPAVVAALESVSGSPAIFNDRAPDTFVLGSKAAIVIAAPADDTDASTYSETNRASAQEVRLYAKDTGSTATLDALARLVRDLFHLRPSELTVDGGSCTLATATGPVQAATTDPSLIGRRVSLRLQLQKA